MDAKGLGKRIQEARVSAGVSQEDVRKYLDLGDRTAVSRIESGDRRVTAVEMFALAELLNRPLQWFVAEPVPALISRRTDAGYDPEITKHLDEDVSLLADDVRFLQRKKLLNFMVHFHRWSPPLTHADAERIAREARRSVGMGDEPISNVGATCEKFGMYIYFAQYGKDNGDGACVDIESDDRAETGSVASAAAAVVNGSQPIARVRMTAIHELAHRLVGDVYDRHSSDSETMVKSLAVHILAPRTGVSRLWYAHPGDSERTRAIRVAGTYQISWTALVSQLRNLDLISFEARDQLAREYPKPSEFAALQIELPGDLTSPQLSPALAAAAVRGYDDAKITRNRALRILRGSISDTDLRPREDRPFTVVGGTSS
ncbi:helix-turn-helix domain-containing protein [Tsukamurella tyrosinosolvens]|nr:helix-turn-helix transcriptional regulator [Tsukamurella tyrosinosolvens]KXO99407.1 hypothetical protein AXK58_24080 [Tsukamurella tyrosinosolvens]